MNTSTNDFYMVIKGRMGYCLMKDKFNPSKTYAYKPIALFGDRDDAIAYARLRNERPNLFNAKPSNYFDDEDDGPHDSWAIVNGYY